MSLESTDLSTSPGSATEGGGVDNTPAPIEIRDDTLVKVPGVDKPVKFSEHVGGLKSNFTRTSQELADLKRRESQWSREKQDYENKLRSLTQSATSAAKAGDRSKLVDSIRSLSYLTGKDAADILEYVTGQQSQFGQALSQRDLAILALAKEVQNLKGVASQFTSQTANQRFEGNISKVAKDVGIPERLIPRLQEVYLAYEPGDALDREFPSIAKQWWEDMQTAAEEARKARLDDARRKPFVPGKGGSAVPSKPLDTSKLSNDELADMFFGMVGGGGET